MIAFEPKLNFKKLIPFTAADKKEELFSTEYYQRKIMKLKEENEQFVLQQLALQSYQRELNTIYKK